MTERPEHVILLHGLARRARSMGVMARALRAAGYTTDAPDYPSTRAPIEDLARSVLPAAIARAGDAPRIHIVTHSMGGILARAYLQDHAPERLGRVVMFGPPNHGSALVNSLQNFPPFHWLYGPAAPQLAAGRRDSYLATLGPAPCPLGVIAGRRSINPITSALLTGPNDGTVTVAATRLAGMADHITLPVSHTLMMMSPLAMAQVRAFLRDGAFDRSLQSRRPAALDLARLWRRPALVA